jgi:hypothetical protein
VSGVGRGTQTSSDEESEAEVGGALEIMVRHIIEKEIRNINRKSLVAVNSDILTLLDYWP